MGRPSRTHLTATSGLWVSPKTLTRLDRRTRLYKSMATVRHQLEQALGGDVSPQQSILIDRVAYLLYRVTTFETHMMNGKATVDTDSYYLAWVGTLSRTLSILGLKRVPKELDLERLLHDAD